MNNEACIIVVGNEKGGAGKTTTAMHLITSLLYLGFKVVSIDLDIRQASLTSYIENRLKTIKSLELDIPVSNHCKITPSVRTIASDAAQDQEKQFVEIISREYRNTDFIVIDTPGADNYISRLAHSYADIIITPTNDSFLDINLLATINPDDFSIIKPGIYSQMVWEQKMNKAKRDKKSIEWLVMRNRISAVDAHNKRNIEKVVKELAKRIGCKIAPGFGERVIFKELFLKGLTLLDLKNPKLNFNFTTSHVIARQELIGLLQSLSLPVLNEALERTVF